jgi:ribonuclease BN (tRNA processing enzyme)
VLHREAPLTVTLLGSGSPTPSLARCHPAVVVSWGERHVLVDAGDGVVAQLLRAGIPTGAVEHVAITHLHWDHVLGYPAFVWGSWMGGRSSLQVWGPTGTADMHHRLVADFYRDQAAWAIDLGFSAEGWHETNVVDIGPGWSAELDGCTIEAGAVVHPPMAALAYRFTFDGRSVVISGDTAACEELVQFSRRADLLVVDACAADPPDDASPQRQDLIRRLRRFHASPQQCIAMAVRADAAAVVLTHHLPEADLRVDRQGYGGAIHVGADLDRYVV